MKKEIPRPSINRYSIDAMMFARPSAPISPPTVPPADAPLAPDPLAGSTPTEGPTSEGRPA